MFTFHQYFILFKFYKRDVFSFTNLYHFINFNIIKIKYSNFVQLQVYQKRTCFNKYERSLFNVIVYSCALICKGCVCVMCLQKKSAANDDVLRETNFRGDTTS